MIYHYLKVHLHRRGVASVSSLAEDLPLYCYEPLTAVGFFMYVVRKGLETNFNGEEYDALPPYPDYQAALGHQALIFAAARYQERKEAEIPQFNAPPPASLEVLRNWIVHDLAKMHVRLAAVMLEALPALLGGSIPEGW